jgi:alpha-L-fucosidase
VAIRRHWFWQPDDLHTLKSRDHLLAIWYRSVGLGAGLLLNLPPDRRGLIDDNDRARLLEFTDELRRRFASPQRGELVACADGTVRVRYAGPVTFDHLELREDLARGQHITAHRILADGREIAAGYTVGVRRVHAFRPVTARGLCVELTGPGASLISADVFLTGASAVPDLEEQPPFMAEKMDAR